MKKIDPRHNSYFTHFIALLNATVKIDLSTDYCIGGH